MLYFHFPEYIMLYVVLDFYVFYFSGKETLSPSAWGNDFVSLLLLILCTGLLLYGVNFYEKVSLPGEGYDL